MTDEVQPATISEHHPDPFAPAPDLRHDLERLLNRHCRENRSGTPDFILATYLIRSLAAFDQGIRERDRWWGFVPMIGGTVPAVDEPDTPGLIRREPEPIHPFHHPV